MDLITAGALGKAIGTDKPTFEKLNNILLKTLKLNQINQLYNNHYSESGIEDIEIGKFKVPILFKKYLQQNGKIIGFNRDPKFNNALDGLMILDVSNIPTKTLKNLSNSPEEFGLISNRFYGQYHNNFHRVPQF